MAGTDTVAAGAETGGSATPAETEGVTGVDGTESDAARVERAGAETVGAGTAGVTGGVATRTAGVTGVAGTDTEAAGVAGTETDGAGGCADGVTGVGRAGGLTAGLEEVETDSADTWTGADAGVEGVTTDVEWIAGGAD